VTNHRLLPLLVAASAWSVGSCTSEASIASTSGNPGPSVVAASDDRSVDVSYSEGMIELSFARLGQPFRGMHAKVLTWNDGVWRYYGILRTGDANTIGTLTTAAADQVEVLEGANTAPAPDRYRAPGLPAGRYLVCTDLVEPDNRSEVCGELSRD
jgi:hypothetical protein